MTTEIHAKMAAVLAALPAIGKGGTAPASMGGYKFRGIEQVLDALNPILSEQGVYYTPRVIERVVGTDRGKMHVVNLHVEYTFHCADGSSVTASVWGEGSDTGDKSTQKAMTAAQKYMLFQVFAIATEDQANSDSDRTGYDHSAEDQLPDETEAEAKERSAKELGWESAADVEGYRQAAPQLIATLDAQHPLAMTDFRAWAKDEKGWKGLPMRREAAVEFLDRLYAIRDEAEEFSGDEQQDKPVAATSDDAADAVAEGLGATKVEGTTAKKAAAPRRAKK